ncbi:MAG: type 2 isopentenyl-diphosphate Delta-isomerase [archaeon]|nr:type 2 isopentenyl-diphosphate Delta-isomerase [archaeon]
MVHWHMSTTGRKLDHIKIVSNEKVEAKEKTTLLEEVELIHNSLPGLDRDSIDVNIELFGKKLKIPFLISGMTGGHPDAEKFNLALAEAAEQSGSAFGLGSQRAMLEDKSLSSTYKVRSVAPTALIFGNIGIPQISEYSPSDISSMLDDVGADALAVHLNPLQESVQPEGDVDMVGLAASLKDLVKELGFPVIVKETGAGISKDVAKILIDCGVSAIDTGGAGGTSFAAVELFRKEGNELSEFWDWGIPTAASILEIRAVSKEIPLIATGGIRSGLDAAKAIALGANVVGMAGPMIKAATKGSAEVLLEIEKLRKSLGTAMFLCGASKLSELVRDKTILNGALRSWQDQRGL